jgi:hypothetical protein
MLPTRGPISSSAATDNGMPAGPAGRHNRLLGNQMNMTYLLRGAIAATTALSLSGCLSTVAAGGGGAGGGGNPSAAYATNLDRVQMLGPQTVRQTGTVNYVGKTRVETTEPGLTAPNGHFIGDVDLDANFDSGAITGTATNFAGQVDGTAVTLAGTLSTANTPDPNTVTQQDNVLPVIGTVTTGALVSNMRGTLTESINNQSSTVQLSLIGTFSGTNAAGAHGAAAVLVGDENAVGFGIAGGGTFYLDRQ